MFSAKIAVNLNVNQLYLQKNWTLGNDKVFHFTHDEKNEDEFVPAVHLAEQTISYARELEMIV